MAQSSLKDPQPYHPSLSIDLEASWALDEELEQFAGIDNSFHMSAISPSNLLRDDKTSPDEWTPSIEPSQEVSVLLLAEGSEDTDFPDKELQWRLLQHYLDWIHPQLPFLDIQNVVATILAKSLRDTDRISPLLAQAIFYAGSLYADEADLECGYSGLRSKWHKQQELFQQANVCESSSQPSYFKC